MGAIIVILAIMVFLIAGMWRIYEKGGKPGWACIVPIYNTIVMLQIVKRPTWWFILYFVPIVSLVVAIIVTADLAKVFGKGTGFAIGLIFLSPIFFPILGFGSAEHEDYVRTAPMARAVY